ncbi:MAG: glycosyltransferase family 4 protein [Bacteroidales bacterium]
MIIGVNTRLLLKGRLEGIGYFAQQTLLRMVVNHPQDTFVFFFDRPYDDSFVFSSNVVPVIVPCPARHPLLWSIYFDYLLPIYCRKYKIEKFFSPENYIPKLKDIPIVCTIHDINFFHNDKYIGNNSHQRYFMTHFPRNARKCERIVTVSEYSKKDIAENFDIPKEKIDVVYNAANNVYRPQTEEINLRTKMQYTGGKDYFYFVGAIHKRKNLVNIFLAFDEFKRQTQSDVKLLIIGAKKWWQGEIEDTYSSMQFKDEVIFTGRLETRNVALIASAALSLVFPSLFEGFGIPVVEAFAVRTAVITSNTTSLLEIAGQAALLVNPYSVEEIAEAMKKLYENEPLRKQLQEKAYQRQKLFSWDDSSEKLWNIISKLNN